MLSREQEEFRRSVRDFLRVKSPESAVRRLMRSSTGYDPAVWRQMSDQLGLQGLAIPERYGGGGFGAVEAGVVLEEMGRVLLCAPFFSTTVLAAGALLASTDEGAKKELLREVSEGRTIASLALPGLGRPGQGAGAGLTARRAGGHWEVRGAVPLVLDGANADLIIAPARHDDGLGLFAVPGDSAGLVRTPLETLDATRRLARVDFANASAWAIGGPDEGRRVLPRVFLGAATSLAAEQVGGAQRMMEMAVEHAATRVQFGRPIGAFQGVKHACADMLVSVEAARSAVHHALRVADEEGGAAPAASSMAKALSSEAFAWVATEAIQVLGGIGVTWEHPAHLYYRRAMSGRLLFGDPDHHWERLVRCVTGGGGSDEPEDAGGVLP